MPRKRPVAIGYQEFSDCRKRAEYYLAITDNYIREARKFGGSIPVYAESWGIKILREISDTIESLDAIGKLVYIIKLIDTLQTVENNIKNIKTITGEPTDKPRPIYFRRRTRAQMIGHIEKGIKEYEKDPTLKKYEECQKRITTFEIHAKIADEQELLDEVARLKTELRTAYVRANGLGRIN